MDAWETSSPAGNPRKATGAQLHEDGATCVLAAGLGNRCLSGAAPRLHRHPPAGLRCAFSPRHRSPLGKSLLEHSQAYLSTCSISRSRGGRRCRATVLHVTAPSIKPGIAPKTDVLAPSHLLQPFTRLPELLQQKKMKKKGSWRGERWQRAATEGTGDRSRSGEGAGRDGSPMGRQWNWCRASCCHQPVCTTTGGAAGSPLLEIEKHQGSLPHCRVAAGSWQGRPPGSSASLEHPFRCFSPQFSYLSLASLNLARPQRFAPWHGRTGSVQTGSVNN